MIINLGLVELGGEQIDGVQLDGYIFKFVDQDPDTANIRVWYNVKKLTGYYERMNAEVRIFVNYDSLEFIAAAVKWFTIFRDSYMSICLFFKSGKIVTIK